MTPQSIALIVQSTISTLQPVVEQIETQARTSPAQMAMVKQAMDAAAQAAAALSSAEDVTAQLDTVDRVVADLNSVIAVARAAGLPEPYAFYVQMAAMTLPVLGAVVDGFMAQAAAQQQAQVQPQQPAPAPAPSPAPQQPQQPVAVAPQPTPEASPATHN